MVLQTFCSTLGNAYLQRHLLAVATTTVEAAVSAENESLQVKMSSDRIHPTIPQVDNDKTDEPDVAAITDDTLSNITMAMNKMSALLNRLQHQNSTIPKPKPRESNTKKTRYWGCGNEGVEIVQMEIG